MADLYDEKFMQRLTGAYYNALLFMMDKCKNEGWFPVSNYLREHARSSTGLRFSNNVSPQIYRRLKEQHPELRQWIETTLLKDERGSPDLFDG